MPPKSATTVNSIQEVDNTLSQAESVVTMNAWFKSNNVPLTLAGKKVMFGISVEKNKRCDGDYLEIMVRDALFQGAQVQLLIADSVQEENLLRDGMTPEEINAVKKHALGLGDAWLKRNAARLFKVLNISPHPKWKQFNEINQTRFLNTMDVLTFNRIVANNYSATFSQGGKEYTPSLKIIRWAEVEADSLNDRMTGLHERVFSNVELTRSIRTLAANFTPKSAEMTSEEHKLLISRSVNYITREIKAIGPYVYHHHLSALLYPGSISETFSIGCDAYYTLLSQGANESRDKTLIGDVTFATFEGKGYRGPSITPNQSPMHQSTGNIPPVVALSLPATFPPDKEKEVVRQIMGSDDSSDVKVEAMWLWFKAVVRDAKENNSNVSPSPNVDKVSPPLGPDRTEFSTSPQNDLPPLQVSTNTFFSRARTELQQSNQQLFVESDTTKTRNNVPPLRHIGRISPPPPGQDSTTEPPPRSPQNQASSHGSSDTNAYISSRTESQQSSQQSTPRHVTSSDQSPSPSSTTWSPGMFSAIVFSASCLLGFYALTRPNGLPPTSAPNMRL